MKTTYTISFTFYLAIILTIIFITLKVTDIIDWDWYIILSPVFIVGDIWFTLLFLYTMFMELCK